MSANLARLAFIKNMGWNLLGQLAPMLAALLAMPVLIRQLGVDRFGLLSIGWMLIGYFSLFDLGLGRALTQSVAARRARQEAVADIIHSGLAVMLAVGVLAAALLWLGVEYLISTLLKVPAALQQEARDSLLWLLPAIPMVVLATGLRGVLEALQAFKLVNLVRTPLGVLTFVAPLAVLPYSHSLVPMFALLMVVRLVTLLFFVLACQHALPEYRQGRWSRQCLPELLRFGGWMTLSNIIGPLMVNMDRLLIGAVLSLAAVSYYSTPFDIIMRALIVPGAIAGVCFPMFAASSVQVARKLFWQSCGVVLLAMLAMLLLIWPLGEALLAWWLNPEFARHSAPVLAWLALGVALNGMAHIPFAYVQGIGQSKVTAQFHLLELCLYLPLLWFCIHWQGIVGVALAWTLRAALDAALLFRHALQHMAQQSRLKPLMEAKP
jgi:O-antigen/teichoic acid export membrane protein